MDGGRRGGGYGPTFIFCAKAPSFSRARAAAADNAESMTVHLGGMDRENVATAAAIATNVSTLSALRALSMLARALAHDLQFIVCEW